MSFITDHKQKFADLDCRISRLDQLKKEANGGNSILFSYLPNEEKQYIEKAKELYLDQAEFIDISKLFVAYIDSIGWDDFKSYYSDFKSTPHLVFKSDDPNQDLFDIIIEKIVHTSDNNKIPFLIRTGSLYGTGIENVNIMENPEIMKLKHPLVIFYPSRIENDNLYYLNFKSASKYRCILVK